MFKSIPHTAVTEISPPTSLTLLPVITLPLQTTKPIRSNLDTQNDPNKSEKSAFNDNTLDATNREFQLQNTATLPISPFEKTHRGCPLDNPFIEILDQFQEYSTLTNHT